MTAVALIDLPRPAAAPTATTSVTPVAGLHDPFALCASGLSGDADANLVKINGEFALVLAASPECIVVLAPAKAAAGPAKVSVEVSPTQATPADLNIRLADSGLARIRAAGSCAAAGEKEPPCCERSRIGPAASHRR